MLRCATYNVRNLFLETCHGGRSPRKRPAELRALVRTVNNLAADVLVLQEVGPLQALMALNGRLADPYPCAGRLDGNSDRGIGVAVLSRFPLSLTSHAKELLRAVDGAVLQDFASAADAQAGILVPQKLQRDLLQCELTVADQPLAVFSIHLKSPINPAWRRLTAESLRHAECLRVAQLLEAYQRARPDVPVLLLGDFNDLWESGAMAPLRAVGMRNLLAEQRRQDDDPPVTYWPRRGAAIDLVLASPLASLLVVPGSVQVHVSRHAQRASDHYPVSVDLALPAAVSTSAADAGRVN